MSEINVGASAGIVAGHARIIGPDGKVKGEFDFRGETTLSEEEFKEKFEQDKNVTE